MMNPVRIISRKRDGESLTSQEIADFIDGYASGRIPDYQMSALAMAIFLRGMDSAETADLTEQMIASGTPLSWEEGPPVVDKHSTGGIGDKVSLILAPLLACCGCRVPMISGRGLGPTGGTLDKLEAIPGFRTDLDQDEIRRVTNQVGCVITGATAEIAPADKKLYGLRDVTATVASIPLITASIMSKKLSEGLDVLALDVKCGNGAFMKTLADALRLAESMVETGKRMGVATLASITDMSQPLGRAAGNAIEVNESLDVLQGKGPQDLRELCAALTRAIIQAIDPGRFSQDWYDDQINSGRAMEKFEEMVVAQGGRPAEQFPTAKRHVLEANRSGFVETIATEELGWLLIEMGAGRQRADDKILHDVGIRMTVRVGDQVETGQPLMDVHLADLPDALSNRLRETIVIGEQLVNAPALVIESIA